VSSFLTAHQIKNRPFSALNSNKLMNQQNDKMNKLQVNHHVRKTSLRLWSECAQLLHQRMPNAASTHDIYC